MNTLCNFLIETAPRPVNAPKLRVAVLLSKDAVPAWTANCVREAASLPFVDLQCLWLPSREAEKPGMMYRVLLAQSRKRYDVVHTEALDYAGIGIECREDGSLTEDAEAVIRRQRFDLLFAPQPGILRGDCRGLARYGIWSVSLDDTLLCQPDRELFRVAHGRKPVFSIGLTVHRETWEKGNLFLRHTFPNEPGMWFTLCGRALEGLGAVLAVQLLTLWCNGDRITRAAEKAMSSLASLPVGTATGSASVLCFGLARSWRSAILTALRRDGGPGPWFVSYAFSDRDGLPGSAQEPSIQRQRLAGVAGHEAADPFVAVADGQTYVFFEDIVPPSRKGRLAVQQITGSSSGPAHVLMETPGHLSYPCVFHHEGVWYMIPESASALTVDLFRAASFPLEWSKVATLASGLTLVDTTPIRHQGIWYFFTTAEMQGGWKVNLLFLSEQLTGPWRSHPCSPLSVDSLASRGAGHIWTDRGRMIRPVQDCGTDYGYAVVFREIRELTPDSFREEPVGRLDPDWQPGLRATHTWNRRGPLEVRDGRY